MAEIRMPATPVRNDQLKVGDFVFFEAGGKFHPGIFVLHEQFQRAFIAPFKGVNADSIGPELISVGYSKVISFGKNVEIVLSCCAEDWTSDRPSQETPCIVIFDYSGNPCLRMRMPRSPEYWYVDLREGKLFPQSDYVGDEVYVLAWEVFSLEDEKRLICDQKNNKS